MPSLSMPATRLPMFPLSAVLFPHASMSLHVFEPRYRDLMRDCLAADGRFGVVLIERGSEVGGGDQRAGLGTRGVITRAAELADGRWALVVRGETVVQIDEWLPDSPYPLAMVSDPPTPFGVADAGALLHATAGRVRRARALLAEQGGAAPLRPEDAFDGEGDAERACWQLSRGRAVERIRRPATVGGGWNPRTSRPLGDADGRARARPPPDAHGGVTLTHRVL